MRSRLGQVKIPIEVKRLEIECNRSQYMRVNVDCFVVKAA
jgi:hypothetical protein